MSDNYLTVIPTDPYWRPGKDAADRAAAVSTPQGAMPTEGSRPPCACTTREPFHFSGTAIA